MQNLKYKVLEKNKINNNNIESIFLYGEEVDDYKTLKKSVIFAMNVRATQELYRQQQADKARITQLETELAAIKQHLGI